MKFYFDNNLSPHLARAMSELAVDEEEGDEVVFRPRDRGMDRMKDPEYIDILSREGGWTIVTTDVAMSRNPHLVRALASSGLVSVSLRPGWLELGGRRMALQLLRRCVRNSRDRIDVTFGDSCNCSGQRENPTFQPPKGQDIGVRARVAGLPPSAVLGTRALTTHLRDQMNGKIRGNLGTCLTVNSFLGKLL